MLFSKILKFIRRLGWVSVAMGVAACATLGPTKPEEVVRERAQARWNALLAGEFVKAYRYMAPSYRAIVAENRYANQFGGGVAWVDAKVIRVSCTEERCTARVEITFRPIMKGRPGETVTTGYDETWIREEGEWWMYQQL